MTTLKDILRDFQTDSIDLVSDDAIQPEDFKQKKDDLLNDYIVIIKERIVG